MKQRRGLRTSRADSGSTRWNGDYCALFDHDKKTVEAGLGYGFMIVTGGDWLGQPLLVPGPGDRVWVHMGRERGFGGVAEVVDPPRPVDGFTVTQEGVEVPVTEVVSGLRTFRDEPASADYAVRLNWTKSVPSCDEGVWERGFFADRNPIARPNSPEWDYTVARLKAIWGIADSV